LRAKKEKIGREKIIKRKEQLCYSAHINDETHASKRLKKKRKKQKTDLTRVKGNEPLGEEKNKSYHVKQQTRKSTKYELFRRLGVE
jgi:hypothetical protein